ncbi:MAG: hypothetical protein KAR47_00840 [Planctomycetes bacterium]|nr:hypothetical protein [Planctomycetota bacterium]
MKALGYLLITIAFLGGSLTAVVDETDVWWGWFACAMAAGSAGVTLVYLTTRANKKSGEKLGAGMADLRQSLAAIAQNAAKLNAEKESINTYDVRHRIDELFPDEITRFVEARECIAHVHGLQAYGDIMSYFAAGERYLNRVWSASADGYIDEVYAYLEKAQNQFHEATEKLDALKE